MLSPQHGNDNVHFLFMKGEHIIQFSIFHGQEYGQI